MDITKRVVWSEGMLLTPQLFQQWDRYSDNLLSQRLQALTTFGWGIAELDIDHDGLSNGRFTLLSCTCILPDGLVIRIPDEDLAPQTRVFADRFSTSMEHLNVYLSVPIDRADGINCQLGKDPGSRIPRYATEHIQVVDVTTGDNPQEVLVAHKNVRILFAEEEDADQVSIKIAELVRAPTGAVALRETYIPPCVWISAAPYLLRMLRGLIELLTAKLATFSDAQRGPLDIIGSDLGKFALVTAISSHLPVLLHLSRVEKVHPEMLYLAMARLAGQLMILVSPSDSQNVPAYEHEDLARSFQELDRRIRTIIEGATPTRYVPIPLESTGDNVWIGRVPESRLFATSQFFLMASGDLSEDQIRTLIPQHIKIGSPSKLKDIVAAAMPGVRLYHTPRPPATLPMKTGTQYFRLDDRGLFWEEIKKSQVLAIHVPDSLHAIRVQLVATKE
ncbi:MAG: type VI secretion system baseplate subunit TssK [Nitrospiraceae bacterium]